MRRAVFFGTPASALPALAALREVAEVALVVTRPDRARGRSGRLQSSPVKQAAEELALPLAQPERAAEIVDLLREAEPDVGVVVAYGQLLPARLLAIPPFGLLNLHFSLLPRWRGAAPVQRAILSGDQRTGVSLMLMDEGLDTGPVLARAEIEVLPDETAGELTGRLAELGAALLRTGLPGHLAGELSPEAQDEALATQAPKVAVEEAHLDPWQGAAPVLRGVRAFNPRPGAWGVVGDQRLKVWRARLLPRRLQGGGLPGVPPGTMKLVDRRLLLATADQPVELVEVQPAGGKAMTGEEWARGRRGPLAGLR